MLEHQSGNRKRMREGGENGDREHKGLGGEMDDRECKGGDRCSSRQPAVRAGEPATSMSESLASRRRQGQAQGRASRRYRGQARGK
jgi:hypothetical protein